MKFRFKITAVIKFVALAISLICSCYYGYIISSTDDLNKDLEFANKVMSNIESAPLGNGRLFITIFDDGADIFDEVFIYGDDEYEAYTLWCDSYITDVRVSEIDYDPESGEELSASTVYSLEQLRVGEALVLKLVVPEGYPINVVSYEFNGNKYSYLLCYNGERGGADLIEYDGTLTF